MKNRCYYWAEKVFHHVIVTLIMARWGPSVCWWWCQRFRIAVFFTMWCHVCVREQEHFIYLYTSPQVSVTSLFRTITSEHCNKLTLLFCLCRCDEGSIKGEQWNTSSTYYTIHTSLMMSYTCLPAHLSSVCVSSWGTVCHLNHQTVMSAMCRPCPTTPDLSAGSGETSNQSQTEDLFRKCDSTFLLNIKKH